MPRPSGRIRVHVHFQPQTLSSKKNNEFMKFLGKQMDLEDMILSEVMQSQENTHGIHSLIGGYYLRISKIQFTDHIKLKKKEEQSVDASVLLRS